MARTDSSNTAVNIDPTKPMVDQGDDLAFENYDEKPVRESKTLDQEIDEMAEHAPALADMLRKAAKFFR